MNREDGLTVNLFASFVANINILISGLVAGTVALIYVAEYKLGVRGLWKSDSISYVLGTVLFLLTIVWYLFGLSPRIIRKNRVGLFVICHLSLFLATLAILGLTFGVAIYAKATGNGDVLILWWFGLAAIILGTPVQLGAVAAMWGLCLSEEYVWRFGKKGP